MPIINQNSMKRAVIVVAPSGYQDKELNDTIQELEKNGIKYTIASKDKEKALGKLGGITKVSLDITKIKVENFDAIIYIGGPGTRLLLQEKTLFDIAEETLKQGKIMAAICMAPSILANAGLLNGKKVTAFPQEKQNLERHGAIFTDEDVTIEGNIITANGPNSAQKFGQTIVSSLSGNQNG